MTGAVTKPPKVRPGFVVLLLLTVVVGGAAIAWVAANDPDVAGGGWQRHELPGGGVSLELPGDVRSDSGSVWAGADALTGSAVWTGEGGLDRAAPGIVVVEGDAAQLGLDAAAVARLGPSIVEQALDAFVEEVGAIEVDPSDTGDGETPGRRIGGAADERFVVVASAVTSGTRVVGIIVTVPEAEAATVDALVDRVTASVEFDS